ncbi:hypothetical protein Dimus_023100, partial [Dionaea muscipula]
MKPIRRRARWAVEHAAKCPPHGQRSMAKGSGARGECVMWPASTARAAMGSA